MKILNQEPNLRVVIRNGLQNPEICSVIFMLENNGLIFNRINIEKDDPKKGYKKDDILVSVSNWKALHDYYFEIYENDVADPYGQDKQLAVVKKLIIEKSGRLENKEMSIGGDDFEKDVRRHIYLIKTVKDLAEKKFIEIENMELPPFADVVFKIKLIGDISAERENDKNEVEDKKDEVEKDLIVVDSPKFRFSNGVLFRDFTDNVLIVKKEDSFEHQLLRLAVSTPVGERIDSMSDIDMKFRQIYDTARNLNTKIEKTFKISDFFVIDFANKYVKRAVE